MPPAQTPSDVSRSNAAAASDYDTLPPVRDAEGNALPITEFGGMEESAEEPVPAEVRQATANIPQTGTLFNLAPFEQIAQLHAAGQTDEARRVYDSLNDQAKYVYNNARNMERFTALEGARLADEFRKMQDAQAKEQSKDKANKPLGEREMQIAMDDIATARNIIQQIRTHKGRSGALGYRLSKPEYAFGFQGKPIAGSAAAGFAGLIEQADAQVFQQVIPRLRGFGSMSEAEGQRAIRAGSRMSIDISEEDFAAAENDLEDFIDRAESRIIGRPLDEIKKARQQGAPEAQPSRTPSPAGSPSPMGSPAPAPTPARQAAMTDPIKAAIAGLGEETVIGGNRAQRVVYPDGRVTYKIIGPVSQQ